MGNIVKSVFGREIDVDEFLGVGAVEAIAPIDQLKLDDEDPQYVYGWLDTRDEATSIKLRKKIWEAVPADDTVKVPGKTGDDDGFIHVRELVLVRMPREKHEAIQRAYVALSLRRESAVAEQFNERAKAIAKNFGDNADPILHKSETVKSEKRAFGAKG